jgi:signal transduction histidine kinase
MEPLKSLDERSPSEMINLEQVYSRRPSQSCPDQGELDEAMRLAETKPGCRFEMPWQHEFSKERYLLTVQLGLPGKAASWYLSAWPLGSEQIPLWALSSSDIALIFGLLQRQTNHAGEAPTIDRAGLNSDNGFLEMSREEQSTTAQVHRLSGEYEKSVHGRIGTNVLIGDLLVRAELIKAAQLADALPLAKKTGLPVGRILIEAGNIDERVLRATVVAQSLIRDGMLHTELGVKALKLLARTDLSLEAALKRLEWRSEYYQTTNKLGHILLDAHCLGREQLAAALEVCFASGLPLGRVLVLRKVVPEVVAYAALSAQVLLREGKIPRNEAVAAVKLASSMKCTIQTWLEHGGMLPATEGGVIRLGELLSLAGIVSELDLLSAVERGLLEEKPIGQILIHAGLINEKILAIALELQARVNRRELGSFEAASILSDAAAKGGELEGIESNAATGAVFQDRGLSHLLSLVGLSDADDPKALLHEVLIQKQNLAYKVVSQHEEVKHRLARDLHDTIIADLLMLRRYLAGDRKLSTEEIIQIVDDVVRQLREICNDFAPRNLHDWGLQMTLQDLAERLKMRTGIDCAFSCNANLGSLPEPVQLHIFRIVQECLNNVEKYAKASQALIQLDSDQKTMRVTVSDNGSGFEDSKGSRENLLESGGMGMQSMRERVELIRCYFPAKLAIQSVPGKGLTVVLELTVGS